MNARSGLAVAFALLEIRAGPIQIKLVSNRAVYDVTLDHTSHGSVAAVRGRTVIEFRDACKGWSTTQRFIADMSDSDAEVPRIDYIVNAWATPTRRDRTTRCHRCFMRTA